MSSALRPVMSAAEEGLVELLEVLPGFLDEELFKLRHVYRGVHSLSS